MTGVQHFSLSEALAEIEFQERLLRGLVRSVAKLREEFETGKGALQHDGRLTESPERKKENVRSDCASEGILCE
jgi:hypothetical protein